MVENIALSNAKSTKNGIKNLRRTKKLTGAGGFIARVRLSGLLGRFIR